MSVCFGAEVTRLAEFDGQLRSKSARIGSIFLEQVLGQ
jgi:hypothetical protein